MTGIVPLLSQLTTLSQPDDASRLYRLTLGDARLLVERWQGRERLSDGFAWWIDVLSTDASLPLAAWLGQPATLHTRLADGAEGLRSGVVGSAACVGSDGGLARYRLGLVPWTQRLTQGRHSRVFQERSVTAIVETVLAGYAPLAVWQVSDEVGGFLAQARVRSTCCQYRESDFDFVQRLLAEDGLGWRIEEDSASSAGHRMVIFADSAQVPEDASSGAGGIRFHRSEATEQADTIQQLGLQRRIGSGSLTVLSDDYKTRQGVSSGLPLQASKGRQANLDAYDPVGAYAFADQADADRMAGLMAQAREARRETWHGQGTVRSLRAGTWIGLTDLPAQGDAIPTELLLTSVHHHGVNNLPIDLREAAEQRLGPPPALPIPAGASDGDDRLADAATRQRAQAVGYANHFRAVPRDRPWRPVLADDTGARLNPRPTAPGYQTALVVGGDDSATAAHELHCDALGRIRVKFHFQTSAEPDDQRSGWVRVAQRYAGPGVGSQFLPRIGQEVLIAFLDGDIDRPIVVGALYNGQGEAGVPATPGGKSADARLDAYTSATDHAPSAQANLAGGSAPPWHGHGGGDAAHRNAAALWGVQSKEWGGSGHNRLVFDDSDGQLRLQLATTHQASQLSLGHLIHQADNYRGSFRGEGFELRTDAWATLRATSGLWLSAYGPGSGPAGDAVPPTAGLTQLQTLGKTFSDTASTHQTVTLASHTGAAKQNASRLIADQPPLQALLTSAKTTVPGTTFDAARSASKERSPGAGDSRVPHTGDALLGLTAPAGIGLVAGQSLHWAVGETLTLASGQASNLAVANALRLHTGQAIGWLAGAVEGAAASTGTSGGSTDGSAGSGTRGGPAMLSLVTAEGMLEFEAQHDEAKLQSRDQLKVISANADVELAAGKTIRLATAGGASLTIEGGNITVECPGTITVHAGKKSFVGPAQLSREMNSWPEAKFDERFRIVYPDGEAAKNYRYEIIRSDGAKINGVSDGDGFTDLQNAVGSEALSIRLLGPV